MEATYTMIGADGQQYGPITLVQLKSWITEGRVTAETKILRSDTNSWLPAANYTELGLAQAAPIAATATTPLAQARSPQQTAAVNPMVFRRVKSGASWFYVVAVFSLINYFLMEKQGAFFLVGMGINILTRDPIVTVIVAGMFALFGFFAGKGHSWSFIVGMILYALDALIFIQVSMWLSFAFHIYALFRMFLGLKATFDLKKQLR
jgi:hypothetical protein